MSCDLMWNDAMGWGVMRVGMWCDSMRLCDVVDRHMMRCELRRPHNRKTLERSRPIRGETLGCKTQKKNWAHVPVPRLCTTEYYSFLECNYDIHVWKSQTMRRPVHCAEQCVGYRTRTTFMFGSDNTWIVQSHNHSHNYHHHCSWGLSCTTSPNNAKDLYSPLYTGPGTIRFSFNGLIVPNHSAAKWLRSSSLRVRAWSRLINWPVGST